MGYAITLVNISQISRERDVFMQWPPLKRSILAAIFVVAACISWSRPSTADPVIFDTFGPEASYDINYRYGVDGSSVFQAFHFIPTESAALVGITVALGRTSSLTTRTEFKLYEGTTTTLGSLLETFIVTNTVPAGISPGMAVTFRSFRHPILRTGRHYWLSYSEPNPADGSSSLWFFNDQSISGTRLTSVLPAAGAWMPAFRVLGLKRR